MWTSISITCGTADANRRYQNTIFYPIGEPSPCFSYLAIEADGEETGTEWLETVSEEDYSKLKKGKQQ